MARVSGEATNGANGYWRLTQRPAHYRWHAVRSVFLRKRWVPSALPLTDYHATNECRGATNKVHDARARKVVKASLGQPPPSPRPSHGQGERHAGNDGRDHEVCTHSKGVRFCGDAPVRAAGVLTANDGRALSHCPRNNRGGCRLKSNVVEEQRCTLVIDAPC